MSIWPLGIKFKEIHKLSYIKIHLKLSSVKWQSFSPVGDELTSLLLYTHDDNMELNRFLNFWFLMEEYSGHQWISLTDGQL